MDLCVELMVKSHPFTENAKEWGTQRKGGTRLSRFSGRLADFLAPGFEISFHLGHELVGDGAVDKAMIVA